MAREVSVAIVGGGITGLATAYYLERLAEEEGWDLKGVLVEGEPRLGGKLLTLHEGGFLVEGGPDSFLWQKPWAQELIKELGMGEELIAPAPRPTYLLHRGRLNSIPEGAGFGAPVSPWGLWKSGILSWRAKLRVSMEPFIRPRRAGPDEALGAFLRRRLGAETARRLAEPFTAGIHAGDADQLSMRALFPSLVDMEQRHGGLARGFRAARAGLRGAPPSSPFLSLRGGMGSLPQAVARRLRRFTLLTGARVTAIGRSDHGGRSPWRVAVQGHGTLSADCLVLAVPAPAAADLVRPAVPQAASVLEEQSFVSTASVSLAFRREMVAHSLNGSGFLVPRDEPSPITGCSWMSSKWPERAPEGRVLLRAFMGWAGDASFMGMDDPEMVRVATESLRPLLGLRGGADATWVHRWPQAMPQYRVGHLEWLDALGKALAPCPGLVYVGASYGGVGVPDCIRQGKDAARRVRDAVAGDLTPTPSLQGKGPGA